MDPDLGWVDLGVRPNLTGFKQKVEAETGSAMGQAGASGGVALGREAGDAATSELSAKFKDWSKKGAVVLGGGLGVAIAFGLREGIDRQQIGSVLAAGQGLSAKEMQRQGKVAGSLYAHAFGDSYEEVARGVASVASSLPELAGNGAIRRASADALNFAQVFGVDVPRNVQLARTIISSGLAKDADRAFDLMVRSSQRVPENVREDLLDAAEEYSQFFKTLGYTGEQAFSLLVANAGQGMFGTDKLGDAIKEFTIRSTDMSKTSVDAYKLIGLSAEEMADKILSGGEDAQEATQKVIDGLLGIESPSERANAAIALFGTPLEDLNVRKIPQFLRSLQGTEGELGRVEGAADRMGKALSNNVSTDITKVKRKLETDLVNFMSEKGLPALESFSDWMDEDGGPLLKDLADFGGQAASAIGEMVGFLNDLPDPAKYVGLTALVGGGVALKVRGGGGGVLGSAGSALGLAKPVPVFVTNPGFGSPSVVPGDGPDKKPRRGGKGGGMLTLLAAVFGEDIINEVQAEALWPWQEGPLSDKGPKSPGDILADKLYDPTDATGTAERVATYLDATRAKAAGLGRELDLVGARKVDPRVSAPGLRETSDALADFIDKQIEARRPVTPYINTTPIERAIALARTMNEEIRRNAQVERGADGGVTYQHGGGGSANPRAAMHVERMEVVAHDYNDFLTQSQRRTQAAGLGGVAGGVDR